jgi:uncharacterized protein YndB with AHSA1/START domain/uncharacterized protein (DUF1330 family)
VPPVYALNLFDLAPNDDYRAYSKRSVDAVGAHGGRAVALGRLAGTAEGDVEPRQVMILVEWPSRAAFDAFVADPAHADLHPLREHGTERYLWWLYDRLDDLRPLLALRRPDAEVVSAERILDVDPAAVWDVAADARCLARWFAGVDEVTVRGRPGQGQRHVARGEAEVARVTENWEPQGYVRWRELQDGPDAAATDTWIELRLEPSATGTRVVLTERRTPGATFDATAAEARLRDSLTALATVLNG